MPTGSINPFQAIATVTLQSTTASTNGPLPPGGESVLVTNATSSLAYVNFGSDASLQATVTNLPVLPNSKLLLIAVQPVTYCAAILSAGTGPILFTRGHGSII